MKSILVVCVMAIILTAAAIAVVALHFIAKFW